MIGKIGRNGKGFGGLVSYLVDGKVKGKTDPNRVAWTAYRNLETEDPRIAVRLMRGTATLSTRCEKPVYHYVVSWRVNENPTPELMRAVGDTTLADLGLADHQVMMVAHNDTEHQHLHVVVNRVHPDSCRAWHTGKDYARLEQSIGRQARERGLLFVEGRHNAPAKAPFNRRRPKDGEYQRVKRCGTPAPLDRWSIDEIKRQRGELAPLFTLAQTWDQLNAQLKGRGLTLTAKGQGVIIASATGFMKLSDLGKEIRLPALERRFAEPFATFEQRRADLEKDYVRRVQDQRNRAETSLKAPATKLKTHGRKPAPSSTETAGTTTPKRKPIALDHAPQHAKEKSLEPGEPLPPSLQPSFQPRQPDPTLWIKPSESANDSTPAFHSPTSDSGARPRNETPRDKAFAALSLASASLDLTRQFTAMGLATAEDLKNAEDELRRALEDVAKHQTFDEFIKDGVVKALTPKPPQSDLYHSEDHNELDPDHSDELER